MDETRGCPAVFPAGLASLPAGAGLAGVLASVDRSVLSADAVLDLAAARARLLWHVQGELLADLAHAVEATLAASGEGERVEHVIGEVGEVVGWLLHWTSAFAQGQVEVGVALARRLPMVAVALREGAIDQAKAAAFVDGLACVDDEAAARIATRLLPKARCWTLTQLRAALRYHVDRADPDAARRRYRRAVAQRDVWMQAQPDGTATLYGEGLAAHRAAAAFNRIDRLARAARSAGDVRTLAQLRADAFCDVLAGVPFTITPTVDSACTEPDATQNKPTPPWSMPGWSVEPRFARNPDSDEDSDTGDDPDNGGPDGGGVLDVNRPGFVSG